MTDANLVPASHIPDDNQIVDPAAYLDQLNALTQAIGQAANQVGSHYVFENFRQKKAKNTLIRHDGDLRAFEDFLNQALEKTGRGLLFPDNALRQDPKYWRGITWGLVDAFVRKRLKDGYAISTVNFALSTIKVYADLAAQAGELPGHELPLIRAVKAIRASEAVRLDEKRSTTRIGLKKAEPTVLTDSLAEALIDQRTDTPQGRRDRLIMCLLLRHGLRVSEIAILRAENFDLEKGIFRFYRPKVTKTQTHQMHQQTWEAAKAFFYSGDAPTSGPLFTESNYGGSLDQGKRGKTQITTRGLADRVHYLGTVIGVDTLSPHDCRHYWATRAAEDGTPLERLKQAGGWKSVYMPISYINDSAVANEGMVPGDEEPNEENGKKRKK